ncbi:hypothetical protein CANARDRAFT_26259 [[Candida] arabinofermentans NRRL YB-2248]|uniref:Uncharacterized protein n=1 Tax=[Candida] arabinofermentans NRRL YB-2248 TaxID=983967 RepID=A0A1E4T8M8_9ASCO|nr:hypothetical protein CANARDRAFT_26259 [[Candida] arabinofermentans NRRL YB-2248]
MATYNVSSTKSYLQAIQPMIDALNELHLEGDESLLKLPTNLKDGKSKQDVSKQVHDLLKSFENVMDNNLEFLEEEEEEEDEFSSDSANEFHSDGGKTEFGLLNEVKANCERIQETNGDDSMSSTQLLDGIISCISSQETEEGVQSMLFDILGFDEFDLISKIVQQKAELLDEYQRSISSISLSENVSRSATPRLMTDEEMREQVSQNARNASNVKLEWEKTKDSYPHVYRAPGAGGNMISFTGKKFSLPFGSTRESYDNYEEITIPKAEKKSIPFLKERLVPIKEMDLLCQGTFKGYKTLNRMQSLIYEVAYDTNENMLVCAPTGAGKTDVALLTILHTIKQFVTETQTDDGVQMDISYDEFKIVYVAPLKALAAEIVEKFSKKLNWLGIQVRELTGDMQLTKAEIMTTQIIVTTPEKWDVVTRKSNGDTELVEKVKLLIIDEVHLLHEDRGSVIETLVARTLRQVESSQSMIRVVGLSATLPNFVDVADFLGVNRNVGMFYFDQSFRPVPLEQQLIGVRAKAGSKQARDKLDNVVYDKLIDMLEQDHQVMIFVHSRKDTVNTAKTFMRFAGERAQTSYFDCSESEKYTLFEKEMNKNKNKDVRELFQMGFGVHHAGMMRSDRNLTEKMFLSGAIKVLCCTATLAWGVNLPAACVIVKGTQVYDSKAGGFVDLGISDVIQIFGRAGRPQYESHGIGILCTTNDRLDHYVSLLLQQHPIESKLSEKLVDNLNAEISLGTVTNIEEGVQWLGYTYLNVRMKQNPFAYGIDWRELAEDPLLVQRRRDMIITAARRLHSLQMIVFDERSTAFIPKDLGRIASDFYLLNESIEIFNKMINPMASEADVLSVISMSSEFDNIKFRDEESKELQYLKEEKMACEIGAEPESAQGKTNILLQAYVSKAQIKDSALISDCNYVAQNAARICRALFLIGINRRWGTFARIMLSICKSIDKQMWSFHHPMNQFELPLQILRAIEAKNPSMDMLRNMDSSELGDLVHNGRMGSILYKLVGRFPYLLLEAEIFPITANVMRVHVTIEADFTWNFESHGNAQLFWIIVEESDKSNILHFEKFILNRKSLGGNHELDFMIPLSDPLPPQVVVRAINDSWIGAEDAYAISFQHLIRPHNETIQTKLLKLQPLPVTALHNPEVENIYNSKFKYFNPMQTMTFHTLYNSNSSVFVGSPTGSGKTVVAELAIWHAFRDFPGSKIVYIAPMKALVRERVDDWRERISKNTSHKVVEMTGDSLPEAREVREADIIITTPEKFDGISRNWQTRKFVQEVSLVIMDEIHLLASDRGPILEMIVSRLNYVSSFTKKPIRLLGLSTAVSNAMDMAGWLGVKEGLFNFPPSVRPVPLQMYIDGFPDNLAFCPLMKTMNKPAFMAIKQHSPNKPVLIFVASRRQTRLTALDLIHLCGMEENPRRFLKMDEDELETVLSKVKDDTLKLSLQFGIGLHHAGLVESDRQISHKLFEKSKIQILVATSTLAWGVNLPAYLVIIKGTQFFDAKIEGYRDMDLTDILQMMGRAGRPAFDTSGVAIVYTKESKKMFYKHFLNVGFPVESSLHKVMDNHIGAEISSGTIKTRQDAMNFLTWTFLYRRAHNNPTYYGIEDLSPTGISSYLSDLIDKVIESLNESRCVIIAGDKLKPTPFLQISSYYYLSHKTIRTLLSNVGRHNSFRQCLRWLSEASEYDELPTRHGEELINMEMSQQMRYPADDLEEREFIWDPHIKTYLLLQAYFERIDLPIADYAQDTVSVLDQSLRILQAYIDATSELGYLSTVLMFIKLMQCIKQACWFDHSFVGTLPGLKPTPLSEDPEDLDGNEISWKPNREKKSTLDLKTIGAMNMNELPKLSNKLKVDHRQKNRFIDVASKLPTGEFRLSQETEDELKVEFIHENKPSGPDFKVYSPKFSKPQRETWFVIICDLETDTLHSIKRESPRRVGKEDMIRGVIKIPAEIRGKKWDVLCVSDFTDLDYHQKFSFM